MKNKLADEHYFDNQRPEIIKLVDTAAINILDVGCGNGKLGAELKRLAPNRKITGVEKEHEAAIEARLVLDEVIECDIQNFKFSFNNETFDCIIFADILEHLLEPEIILKKFKPFLKHNGIIILSIPNMRHYTVIMQLIFRGWEYKDYGFFDRTHLRFFSLNSMKELINNSGLKITEIIPRIVASKKARLLNLLLFHSLSDFLTMQYIFKIHK